MNIVIATTCYSNPGDDFIRAGVFNLLPELVNHNVLYLNRSNFFKNRRLEEYLDVADMFIQAGTPDWLSFHEKEYRIYWKKNIKYGIIGVGYPGAKRYEGQQDWIRQKTTHKNCKSFIVRDTFSHNFLTEHNIDHNYLPCPAYYSNILPLKKNTEKLVGINYYHFSSKDDPAKSQSGRPSFIKNKYLKSYQDFENYLLKEGVNTVIICHQFVEYLAAKKLFKSPIFYSDRWQDFISLYSKLSFYVGSRVHGAISSASFGIPSYHIGIDDRYETCNNFPQISNIKMDQEYEPPLYDFYQNHSYDDIFEKTIIHKEENLKKFKEALSILKSEL